MRASATSTSEPPEPPAVAVRTAARRLFAERGFGSVSIRQIAAEAGVSPAMVMKVGGSKAQLFAQCEPPAPEPLLDIDPDELGAELVRRMVNRRDAAISEPWVQAIFMAVDAPHPEQARAAFADVYLGFLRRFVIAAPDSERRVAAAASLMLGLAVALRPLRLLAHDGDAEWLITHYGAQLQEMLRG